MEDNLQWKTTFNGRRPPMEDDLKWKTTSNRSGLQWKTTSNGRQPPMEDDLQWKKTSNERRTTMEDDLKIVKVCIMTYEFLGGNWRKDQRKSRVWLCSAQLVFKLKQILLNECVSRLSDFLSVHHGKF
jgi:hypothetical protein